MKGTIVKRGSRYSVVVELHRDPVTGKRQRQWHSGYRTKRDAEAARVEILSRLQRGEYVAPSKLTVTDYLEDRWLPANRRRWHRRPTRATAEMSESTSSLHLARHPCRSFQRMS